MNFSVPKGWTFLLFVYAQIIYYVIVILVSSFPLPANISKTWSRRCSNKKENLQSIKMCAAILVKDKYIWMKLFLNCLKFLNMHELSFTRCLASNNRSIKVWWYCFRKWQYLKLMVLVKTVYITTTFYSVNL